MSDVLLREEEYRHFNCTAKRKKERRGLNSRMWDERVKEWK
jgi:hypothetical protein